MGIRGSWTHEVGERLQMGEGQGKQADGERAARAGEMAREGQATNGLPRPHCLTHCHPFLAPL